MLKIAEMSPEDFIEHNTIVKHYAGSISYGTNLPTSDVDFRGVFFATPEYYYSPWYNINEVSVPTEEDTKLYELSNFMKLVVDQNPNILETLWVDDQHIVQSSPVYEYLISVRDQLLSKKAAFTYSGYAHSQLKRIRGHNKWINNPQPVDPPKQSDYVSMIQNFTPVKIMPRDLDVHQLNDCVAIPYSKSIYGVYSQPGGVLLNKDNTIKIDPDMTVKHDNTLLYIIKVNMEEYKAAKNTHKQYWDWRSNRNKARSELEEKYGYDCKHAMHLMRLLRQGVEILRDGGVNVLRHDAEELLQIRKGEWSYDKLVAEADLLDAEIKSLYKTSSLRKSIHPKDSTRILFRALECCWETTSTI